MRVSVVVLGDLERSPRMINHALALAASGAMVDLIGHGAAAADFTIDHARITLHRLPASSESSRRPWQAAAGVGRAMAQALRLLRVLLRVPRPDVILVQTPPALPTLTITRLAARLRASRLVVDWHNLAYTMLALRVGHGHPLVRLLQGYEGRAGGRARHLAVSQHLADALWTRWRIRARVVHDRPAPGATRHVAFDRETIIARYFAGCVTGGAPTALLVAPTSWSLDDDFDLLWTALERCEPACGPTLLVLLTGRGPRQADYLPRIQARQGRRVHIRADWVPAEDYRRVLASADLGLSIHRSSSGLDLPMKIWDLFAAGVPVCALDYGPCLSELVRHDTNGLLFDSAGMLSDQIQELTHTLPVRGPRLRRLAEGARASGTPATPDAWMRDAWSMLVPDGQ